MLDVSTYIYFYINLIITCVSFSNVTISKKLTCLSVYNLLLCFLTPFMSSSLIDYVYLANFLTSISITYLIIPKDIRYLPKIAYFVIFIIFSISSLIIIPSTFLLTSTPTIYQSFKIDHLYFTISLLFLFDIIFKFMNCISKPFSLIFIQFLWSYNSILLLINNWILLIGKDLLINLKQQNQNNSLISFISHKIINLNEIDYKSCLASDLIKQCLDDTTLHNIDQMYSMVLNLTINSWNILNLFTFILIPLALYCLCRRYDRLQLEICDEKKQIDQC